MDAASTGSAHTQAAQHHTTRQIYQIRRIHGQSGDFIPEATKSPARGQIEALAAMLYMLCSTTTDHYISTCGAQMAIMQRGEG